MEQPEQALQEAQTQAGQSKAKAGEGPQNKTRPAKALKEVFLVPDREQSHSWDASPERLRDYCDRLERQQDAIDMRLQKVEARITALEISDAASNAKSAAWGALTSVLFSALMSAVVGVFVWLITRK